MDFRHDAARLCFLAAQIVLWKSLVASGFYINKNHHSGYAYIFTGLHGAHLIGGLIALGYVMLRERSKWTAVRRRVSVDATVLYWHFLDAFDLPAGADLLLAVR